MGAPFNPLVCLLLQVGCTVINYLYGTDLLALLPNQVLGFKHGLNQEGTSPTPSFPRVGALNITRSQTEGTLEYPLFLYSFSSLPHAFWLDNWARSRYSHLPFVVSNETVFYFLGRSNLHKGEGGERCVLRGLSLPFQILPVSIRALQNPFPDEQTLQQMCLQTCILGLFGFV